MIYKFNIKDTFIFIFALKIHFYIKMKIKSTTSNGFDLDKCYPGHNPEQYSRGFSYRTLNNANVDDTVTFKHHNSKSTQ